MVPDLSIYGIFSDDVVYNPSYETIRKIEASLEGIEKTNLGAFAIDTGKFTGRSPKDKYIVKDKNIENSIWWSDVSSKSDNKAINQEIWSDLKNQTIEYLDNKKLYVMDVYCGATKKNRIKVRFISEIIWQAHFVKNMFIIPDDKDLVDFKPDFVFFNACNITNKNWKKYKLNSENFIAFNLTEKQVVLGGTSYTGEMKKGIFSIMNYLLPIKNIASMHCSANLSKDGHSAIFFGLSGTGKTTLSADPNRLLIGDDEHGWDENGIFNFEGGCYAKCINLKEEKEPDIFNAIKENALLENVVVDKYGHVDFSDSSKTENTRVSYPLSHIKNSVLPVSKSDHPEHIIFLTADAFGVLPPVSFLSKEQASYYFLSGYTAKIAGTERGIKEPAPTFSACFGAAFLTLNPTKYAEVLEEKIQNHNSKVYLVNTGWVGGDYNTGSRIDILATRKIVDSILDDSILNSEFEIFDIFNLKIPKSINGVDSNILNPQNCWKNKKDHKIATKNLAEKFINNFKSFSINSKGKKIETFGPIL